MQNASSPLTFFFFGALTLINAKTLFLHHILELEMVGTAIFLQTVNCYLSHEKVQLLQEKAVGLYN